MADSDRILGKLKEFILEQNNLQTENLKTYINTQLTEVKEVIGKESERTAALEKELETATEKIKYLEKKLKKNNIIIFNLHYNEGNLLEFTVTQLNSILNLDLVGTDINNIYQIGKSPSNKPVIVEFVSYLQKQLVLRSCKKLKTSNIRISEVLSTEEILDKRVLVRHMKEARSNNLGAYIYANKLYVNNKPYSVEDLEGVVFGSEGDGPTEEGAVKTPKKKILRSFAKSQR